MFHYCYHHFHFIIIIIPKIIHDVFDLANGKQKVVVVVGLGVEGVAMMLLYILVLFKMHLTD